MSQLSSGMYRPGGSLLHGLDGAIKLICFALLCASVLLTRTAAGYVAMLVFTAALVYLAQVKGSQALSGIRRLRWMLLMILLLELLFACPDSAFFHWWIFSPSIEGLVMGTATVLRLSFILIFAAVLNATSSPLKLNEGLRTLLHPLSLLKLPADHIATMLGVTMRFVPLLFEEADKILYARRARGIKFEKQSFFDTAGASAPLAIPLAVSAFKRAETLSMAMEAKGYRMNGKGAVFGKIRPCRGDWYALFVSAAVFALQIIIM